MLFLEVVEELVYCGIHMVPPCRRTRPRSLLDQCLHEHFVFMTYSIHPKDSRQPVVFVQLLLYRTPRVYCINRVLIAVRAGLQCLPLASAWRNECPRAFEPARRLGALVGRLTASATYDTRFSHTASSVISTRETESVDHLGSNMILFYPDHI